MIVAVLLVVGLCMGSFVNALVWRIREQSQELKNKNADKKYQNRLSISKGRSMCPHCKHELALKDLLPIFSWLSLKGKCRYCGKAISAQYPIVELALAGLFVASYIWWPTDINGTQIVLFVLWIGLLTGLLALLVYDLRWYLLPDRILRPLGALAVIYALTGIITAAEPLKALINSLLAVTIGGGLFYVLFQISKGKWIGGGDVKLGWLLGLIVGTPGRAVLFIFLAALLGTIVSLPLLISNRLKKTSVVPFGPFLIAGAIIVQLFGHDILHWYLHSFFPYTL